MKANKNKNKDRKIVFYKTTLYNVIREHALLIMFHKKFTKMAAWLRLLVVTTFVKALVNPIC